MDDKHQDRAFFFFSRQQRLCSSHPSSPVPPLRFTITRKLIVFPSFTTWSTCSDVGFP